MLIVYYELCPLMQCIHVPYTALTMHLSNDNKERDSVTLYREFVSWLFLSAYARIITIAKKILS